MGDLLQFPVQGSRDKTVEVDDWFFNRERRKVLEDRIVSILSHGRLMFISTLIKAARPEQSNRLYATLGKLEREGVVEQLEVQGETQRIKGYFRLKGKNGQ